MRIDSIDKKILVIKKTSDECCFILSKKEFQGQEKKPFPYGYSTI